MLFSGLHGLIISIFFIDSRGSTDSRTRLEYRHWYRASLRIKSGIKKTRPKPGNF